MQNLFDTSCGDINEIKGFNDAAYEIITDHSDHVVKIACFGWISSKIITLFRNLKKKPITVQWIICMIL